MVKIKNYITDLSKMCAGRPELLFFVKSYVLRAIIRVRNGR
jgi:hypothetical protein